MDPDANLKEQLELAAWFTDHAHDGFSFPEDEDDYRAKADRLAELVNELNMWLVTGGFLPKAWRL